MAHAPVGFPQYAGPPSMTRNVRETPIVSAHETESSTGFRTNKGRHEQRACAVAKWFLDDSEIIEAEVKAKRERHQVPLPHIFVFVAIECFEPRAVTHRKITVVSRESLGHRFASPLRADQFRSRTGRESNPIEARTVKRIEESRGIAHQHET